MKVIKEEEENKLRKNNLIIYNLEESNKDNSNDQNMEDQDCLKDLFRNNLIKVLNFEMVKVFRLVRRGEAANNIKPSIKRKLI